MQEVRRIASRPNLVNETQDSQCSVYKMAACFTIAVRYRKPSMLTEHLDALCRVHEGVSKRFPD